MDIKKSLKENMYYGKAFIDRMDIVFEDLRADFDLSTLYKSKKRIDKLKEINVDITKDIDTIANKAVITNGLISGSRGTGKSHLMLLARDSINSSKKSFCVYINLKEHNIIESINISKERYYLWIILKEFKKQLDSLFINNEENKFNKILDYFDLSKKSKKNEFEKKYLEVEGLIREGDREFLSLISNLKVTKGKEGTLNSEFEGKGERGLLGAKLALKASSKASKETIDNKETYRLIDINTIKNYIIEFKELLEIDSIVFFYDEWSSVSEENQIVLSKLIKGLSISPIFHWIAYVKYMSTLGVLEQTSDITTCKDLDLKYIYEENSEICTMYFKGLANKRIENILGKTPFNIDSLVTKSNLDVIIKASMGNTRDFGIILNYSFENYKEEFLAGREFERLHLTRHIAKAIKKLGNEKENNLEKAGSKYTNKLWLEIQKYISSTNYTHFCIENSVENSNFLKDIEFQELMYYRLLHLRKVDIKGKESGSFKLNVYSCDVSSMYFEIFNVKNQDKKIELVTNQEIINNKIRRYIFKISDIINRYRVEEGKQIICKCGGIITKDMTYALEKGICIYCGNPLGCA